MDNRTITKHLEKIAEQFANIAEEVCNNYCKYPEQWDEEKEGIELSESDICANCPLSRF